MQGCKRIFTLGVQIDPVFQTVPLLHLSFFLQRDCVLMFVIRGAELFVIEDEVDQDFACLVLAFIRSEMEGRETRSIEDLSHIKLVFRILKVLFKPIMIIVLNESPDDGCEPCLGVSLVERLCAIELV